MSNVQCQNSVIGELSTPMYCPLTSNQELVALFSSSSIFVHRMFVSVRCGGVQKWERVPNFVQHLEMKNLNKVKTAWEHRLTTIQKLSSKIMYSLIAVFNALVTMIYDFVPLLAYSWDEYTLRNFFEMVQTSFINTNATCRSKHISIINTPLFTNFKRASDSRGSIICDSCPFWATNQTGYQFVCLILSPLEDEIAHKSDE